MHNNSDVPLSLGRVITPEGSFVGNARVRNFALQPAYIRIRIRFATTSFPNAVTFHRLRRKKRSLMHCMPREQPNHALTPLHYVPLIACSERKFALDTCLHAWVSWGVLVLGMGPLGWYLRVCMRLLACRYPRNVVAAAYTAHGQLVQWRMDPAERARDKTFFFQGNAARHYRSGTIDRVYIMTQFNKYAPGESLMIDSSKLVNKNIDNADAKQRATGNYAHNMLTSKYCLMVHGDTPTSRRLYDALAAGCVPIIIDDPLLTTGNLPLYPWLDWDRVAVIVRYRQMRADPECVVRQLLQIPEDRCVLDLHT